MAWFNSPGSCLDHARFAVSAEGRHSSGRAVGERQIAAGQRRSLQIMARRGGPTTHSELSTDCGLITFGNDATAGPCNTLRSFTWRGPSELALGFDGLAARGTPLTGPARQRINRRCSDTIYLVCWNHCDALTFKGASTYNY